MNKKSLIILGGIAALIGFLTMTKTGQNVTSAVIGSLKRGERINNPGNIRKGATWQGLAQDQSADSAFAVFTDAFYGIRAMAKLLTNYYNSGLNTISAIIHKYAPASENNTQAYINVVSKISGIAPTTPFVLNADNLFRIMKAMITVEQGRVIYADDDIKKGIAAV